ncbi:transposase [Nocardiopsis dassonvillei]|uniref:transposase n=1 Tax=Nocardiopsis dassonvillei TaxID=2014 RepID=UPI0036703A62
MRRTWMWILAAVGAASLVVLDASLVLPGLEELSWVAGTGLFVLTAAALVLAWPSRTPSAPMLTLSPAPASTPVGNRTGDVHGTAIQADAIHGPVTVYAPLAPAASPAPGWVDTALPVGQAEAHELSAHDALPGPEGEGLPPYVTRDVDGELDHRLAANAPRGGRGKASQCARLRPDTARLDNPVQAARMALRSLARRVHDLDEEITAVQTQLDRLVARTAPTLVSRVGIGTGHAAQLLVTAGQNVDRLGSEAGLARLCGVAPVPVSSGKSHRMRLHRGGDRQANRALHMIAVCRLRYDKRTIDYMRRRSAEGLSKKDVLRCLKRFIAREVFHDLKTDLGLA